MFKTVFLNRLPADMRDLVALQFQTLGAKELAAHADVIWDVCNTKGKAVVAVTPVELEAAKPANIESLLAQAIAAFTVHGKKGGCSREVDAEAGVAAMEARVKQAATRLEYPSVIVI